MTRGSNGGVSNNLEANFVVKILKTFSHRYGNVRNIDIGVISFYNDQVAMIKDKLKDRDLLRWMNSNNVSLQVSTVDGFQGCEKDIIILSCVRSKWTGRPAKNDIGFLKDFRRVNVALTRAKHSLWVVAHCDALNKDALWSALINDASSRKLIAEGAHLAQYTGEESPRNEQTKRKGKRLR